MRITKRKNKIILSIITIVIIILLIVVLYIGIPRIKGHLYNGDHITINLSLNIDESPISLKDLNATCIYDNKDENAVNSDNGTYKTKGGKYGEYSFEVIIPKERLVNLDRDMVITLDYLNTNNWYILESNCVIDLYTNEDGIYGSSNVIVNYNDGTSNEFNKDLKSSDNTININWGL